MTSFKRSPQQGIGDYLKQLKQLQISRDETRRYVRENRTGVVVQEERLTRKADIYNKADSTVDRDSRKIRTASDNTKQTLEKQQQTIDELRALKALMKDKERDKGLLKAPTTTPDDKATSSEIQLFEGGISNKFTTRFMPHKSPEGDNIFIFSSADTSKGNINTQVYMRVYDETIDLYTHSKPSSANINLIVQDFPVTTGVINLLLFNPDNLTLGVHYTPDEKDTAKALFSEFPDHFQRLRGANVLKGKESFFFGSKGLVKPKETTKGSGLKRNTQVVVYKDSSDLMNKLNIAIGSYIAGNKSGSRNKIAKIADELYKNNDITKRKYDSLYRNYVL